MRTEFLLLDEAYGWCSRISFGANLDYTIRHDTPELETPRAGILSTADLETVELFDSAVNQARNSIEESIIKSEKLEKDVRPSLTVDLNRRNLEVLPGEIVQILKRNVERYVVYWVIRFIELCCWFISTRIVLSHNQIGQLPLRFGELTNITYLNLRANRFKEFPRAVSQNTKDIAIGQTDMKKVIKLQKLQVLDLSRNRLMALPEEIDNMKTMRFLSVMHNNLERLPLSLGYLESLRVLKMAGNPMNDTLKQIIDGGDSADSPANTILDSNEKELSATIKIKQYLKSEAAALESEGEYR